MKKMTDGRCCFIVFLDFSLFAFSFLSFSAQCTPSKNAMFSCFTIVSNEQRLTHSTRHSQISCFDYFQVSGGFLGTQCQTIESDDL
jgi:hypothetical protein